ncbi:MAG TPA: peptide deformylase [Candidatus Ligilactobacillus excrementigallinarum]|uniref:Peptide deformylase n=1 Tax=Candidatus Ligilactobacillus excrementigallinarum TaxID=2838641 RepID=A0A9D1UXH6_9LACO|nr:peptide deformylase [Candidatus Ligilactobacillus excrementigallinarum]
MITMDDIIREGHPTLRKRAEKVTFPLSDEKQKLAAQLMEFLENSQDEEIAKKYKLRAGVGLAAPQVNQSIRMTAVLVPGPEGEKPEFKHVLVNPTIISESVQKAALAEGEGCLSVDREVPGYVPRANRIKLRWYDLEGNEHIDRLKGYPAIVVQHEIDHLNGILFFDHINKDNPFEAPEGTLILE